MAEQEYLFSYEPEHVPEKAIVTTVQHGTDGVSFVGLSYKGESHIVALDTANLDIEEANAACASVPEWWDVETFDPLGLYVEDDTSVDYPSSPNSQPNPL